MQVEGGIINGRTILDELQAEIRKLELQASHIQYLINHGPGNGDEMGGEDLDITDVESTSNLPLGRDSGKEACNSISVLRVILFVVWTCNFISIVLSLLPLTMPITTTLIKLLS